MDTPDKLIAMGAGFLLGGVLLVIGIVRKVFPDQDRAKRMWAIIIPGFIVGLILIIVGLTMQ